jgi:hypothetical protein
MGAPLARALLEIALDAVRDGGAGRDPGAAWAAHGLTTKILS